MTPSEMFIAQLRIMDPLLSVRWGNFVSQWVVERKCVTTPHELKWFIRERARDELTRRAGLMNADEEADFTALNEKITSLKDGRRILMFAVSLDATVIDLLKRRDMTGFGGYARYFDAQERRVSEAAALRRAARVAQCDDINVEAYGDGKGRRGIYDYMMDKRRMSKRDKYLRGQITLQEALGLPRDADVLGRGGDVAKKIVVVSR